MASTTKNENGLTARQQAFVNAYLKCSNASQAAREAGYEAKNAGVQACMLLKNPNVIANIRRVQQQATMDAGLTVESLVKKLQSIIFTDPRSTVPDELRAIELAGRYLGMWDGSGAPKGSGDRDRKNTVATILESARKLVQG